MTVDSAHHALFTVGRLRRADVQLDTFGRLVDAGVDILVGYRTDPDGTAVHVTGDPLDKVVGVVLELTDDELDAADEFVAALAHRVQVTLSSGTTAWLYLTG